MTAVLNQLSEAQRKIYDLVAAGKSPESIATKLDITLGVVNAQITRIKNKGINIPSDGKSATATNHPAGFSPTSLNAPTDRPSASGASSNDMIADTLRKSGMAIDNKQLVELAEKVGGGVVKDIHPMILLGVTIQYVKMCGGRMTAHQVIEDVYSALRDFTGTKVMDGDGGSTLPMPTSDHEKVAYLMEQNANLQRELNELRRRVSN